MKACCAKAFRWTACGMVWLLSVLGTGALAADAAPAAADPALELRMQAVASELRCLVCQNQTIADSNAALAVDLRQQVREMLQQGKSEAQIVGYMTERYGDFVRYRPPVNVSTAVLWFGPVLLLFIGVAVLVRVLRRRAAMPAEAFESDPTTGDRE